MVELSIVTACNRNDTLTLLNSTFTENAAKCEFTQTKSILVTYYGGVLYSKGCKISINDGKFQNNLAVDTEKYVQDRNTQSHGGVLALKAQYLSIAVLSHIIEQVKEEMHMTSSYHNDAQQGGVVYVWGSI